MLEYELFLTYKIPNGIKDEEDLKFSYNLLTYIAPKYEKINVSEHSFEERCFYDENTRIEKRTFGDEYQEMFFG